MIANMIKYKVTKIESTTCFPAYPLNVALHIEWGVELFEAMFALCEVGEVEILLFLTVNMPLHVKHHAQVVVQHFVTIPTLKRGPEDTK